MKTENKANHLGLLRDNLFGRDDIDSPSFNNRARHSFAHIPLPYASAALEVQGTVTCERRLAEECGQGNEDKKIVYFTWDFRNSLLGDDDFDSASFTYHLLPASRLTKNGKR